MSYITIILLIVLVLILTILNKENFRVCQNPSGLEGNPGNIFYNIYGKKRNIILYFLHNLRKRNDTFYLGNYELKRIFTPNYLPD